MNTARQHFQQAQELLTVAQEYRADGAPQSAARCISEAHVHALLADLALRLEDQPCPHCHCVRNCECDRAILNED